MVPKEHPPQLRHMALEAMAASEARYRELFENTPIGIYRTTPAGRVLMANPRLVHLLDYDSLEELLQINVEDHGYHKDTPRRHFIERIKKDGEIVGYEAKWLKKDGTPLHVRENAKAIRDGQNNILYYEGTIEDITEQKNAEEKLAYRIAFEKLITSISTRFVNLAPTELDSGVDDALKWLGEFSHVDRGYVFQFTAGRKTMELTHGWAAEGVDEKSSELDRLDTEHFRWSIAQIQQKEIVYIPDVEGLPPEAFAEREELIAEEVQSAVLVPLVCGSSVLGMLGLDSVWVKGTWNEDSLALIRIVGEIFANALERRRIEEELRYRVDLDALITSISARFVNISASDVDAAVCQALQSLGQFLGADRSGVYHFDTAGGCMNDTHFWTASPDRNIGQPAQKKIVLGKSSWSFLQLTTDKPVQLSLHMESHRGADQEMTYLRENRIQSLLWVPFTSKSSGVSILGFIFESEEQVWSEDILSLIRIVGEILASALDRKAAAQELDRERQLVNALMDNTPDCIYFKDLESRFIRVNRAHVIKHGIRDPSQLVGKRDSDLFSVEHANQALKDEEEIIRTKLPIIAKEEKETWADGRETWVSTTKIPLVDAKGEIVGTFGISRDITARKQAEHERKLFENRLQHTQKLESLGILSGGIAHDFNNLLMGILGNTGLALMDLSPASPARGYVKQIEAVALRAAELTNQMLAYSGKSKFAVELVNLTALVKEMANLLSVSIARTVSLELDCREDVAMVEGDPAQIRQVVMNLITNASDAIGDKQGKIRLATGSASCDEAFLSHCYLGEKCVPGIYSFAEVSDTGVGMDAATQDKIFDPFFSTKVTGRGLGLAAVLGIVRAHQGALKLKSHLGEGTTFTVFFPKSLNQTVIAEIKTAIDPGVWRGSGTVLVVDDDEIVRKVTEQILKRAGFTPILAADFKSAREECVRHISDLVAILLDVTLPDSTAQTSVLELRKSVPSIPIMLISGYSEQAATGDVDPNSYQGFLQKPFSPEVLAGALRDLFGKKH